MKLPQLAACFIAGLAGLGLSQAPGQQKPKPRQSDPERQREKPEPLIKVPEDFVRFARVPDGGLRPRLALGQEDLALIYYKGDAVHGDLYLTRTSDEAKTFSPSVRLNATPGTVAAWDGIHAGSVDIGPDRRAHVAWISTGETPSLLYVREAPGTGLDPVQDLGAPPGLRGSTAVTVDAEGQIYLFYVALGTASDDGGAPWYQVWMRRSADGANFNEAIAINRDQDSVSERSAIAAHVDEVMGTLFVLYRSLVPSEGEGSKVRHMRLLSSENKGEGFVPSLVDNLRQKRDPLSSANLSQEEETTLAAWDGDGTVFWAPIRRALLKVNMPVQAKDEERAFWRSQAAVVASKTEVILTWLEQPIDDRKAPAKVGWQIWLRDGRYALATGRASEPGTSPVVFPRKERGFTILH